MRARRAAQGLSQAELATRVGVSRQALSAIESERQVPSTVLALQLARSLGCSVDELFQLAGSPVVDARVATDGAASGRAIVGRVGGAWVAHPARGATHAADGRFVGPGSAPERATVELFGQPDELGATVLVAGCAPLLGIQSDRLSRRSRDTRASWIQASSAKALSLLEQRLVHVAGIHLAAADDEEAHARAARQALRGEPAVLVNLACWRQGLIVAPGNPLGVTVGPDLLRPGLRYAVRDSGAAAQRLLERTLAEALGGRDERPTVNGTPAADHDEVGRLVRWGVVDVGVAIESTALREGLDFIPLSEERFDLVIPSALVDHAPVARFLDLIDQPSFRSEVAQLPGYDLSRAGHATTVDVA